MAIRPPDFIIKSGGRTSGSGSGSNEFAETPIGALNGSNAAFTLTYAPTQYPIIWLFLNGNFQKPSVDFTLSGNTITYSVAPKSTDQHFIIYKIGPATPNATGTARAFAGGTDQIDYGGSSLYKLLGDVSIGFWVKLSANSAGVIIKRGKNSTTVSESYDLLVAGSSGSWNVSYLHDYGANLNEQHTFATAIPNEQWRYVGISRNNTAKTVSLYLGNGATLSLVETWAYAHTPEDADAGSRLTVGNDVGGSGGAISPAPFIGALQQHYVWNRPLSLAEHQNAMTGSPSMVGLILSVAMGSNPEVDTSGNGGSGVVTGTTLVQGHS